MPLSKEDEAFKAEYIRERGYWVPFNDGLLAYSPDYLKTYLRYASVPVQTGPLSQRMCELIYVAVDTSTTHMFGQGLAIHVRRALEVGCTPTELIEVMQLATAQGLDSVAVGVDMIAEELAAAGVAAPVLDAVLSADQSATKDRYVARFGDWPGWCDRLIRFAPQYFAVLTELFDVTATSGAIDDKDQSLILLALSASPTHLDRDSMRLHMRRALRHGATAAELVQVMQLVAHLGVHASVIGVPLIVQAAEAAHG